MNEDVSIIMPAFNAELTISDAIRTVQNQTYRPWVLYVVDDNSHDSTSEVVSALAKSDPRIILIKNKENRGPAEARNIGIERANGKAIAFLDADDLWAKNKLSLQLPMLDLNGVVASHSSYCVFEDKVLGEGRLKKFRAKSIVTQRDLLRHNFITNSSGIYSAERFGKIYQENVRHEDYDMWMKILARGRSVGLSSTLCAYRIRRGSVSSNKLSSLLWHYQVMARHEPSGLKRGLHFGCHLALHAKRRIMSRKMSKNDFTSTFLPE